MENNAPKKKKTPEYILRAKRNYARRNDRIDLMVTKGTCDRIKELTGSDHPATWAKELIYKELDRLEAEQGKPMKIKEEIDQQIERLNAVCKLYHHDKTYTIKPDGKKYMLYCNGEMDCHPISGRLMLSVLEELTMRENTPGGY